MTLPSFAAIWLLPALPFVSVTLIACVPALRKLTSNHHAVTWPIGILGLGCLFAGLIGSVSPAYGLPMMLVGGAVSGFAMFSVRRAGDDSQVDEFDGRPPPDDPPPPLRRNVPIDWQLFDRLRKQWETPPVPRS